MRKNSPCHKFKKNLMKYCGNKINSIFACIKNTVLSHLTLFFFSIETPIDAFLENPMLQLPCFYIKIKVSLFSNAVPNHGWTQPYYLFLRKINYLKPLHRLTNEMYGPKPQCTQFPRRYESLHLE